MNDAIEVLAVRAFYMYGEVVAAGTVASLPAADAAVAVSTGRAQYVHPEERELAIAAARADDAKRCPDVPDRAESWVRRY